MARTQRPVNLNLFTIKFPITAIASIMHRLSGCALFFLIPAFLWIWDYSLQSDQNFLAIKSLLAHPFIKGIAVLISFPLFYYIVASIRHVVMDIGFGESLSAARFSAYLVIILAALFALGVGVSLC